MDTRLSTFVAAFLLACASVGVQGYGSGAPPSACATMVPGHQGTQPQTVASPYFVNVNVSSYTAGQAVAVTINGSELFQGLLLQARKAGSDDVVGTFQTPPSNIKFRPCPDGGPNNGLTHTDTSTKSNMTFMWNPPSSAGTGNVQFYATVLKEKPTYWVKLASTVLSETTGDGSGSSGLLGHVFTVVAAVFMAKFL